MVKVLLAIFIGLALQIDGVSVGQVAHGESFEIVFDVFFNARVDNPMFGVALRSDAGHGVLATSTQWSIPQTGVFEPGETVTVRLQLDAWFGPARYQVNVSVARRGGRADDLDLRLNMTSFVLHSTRGQTPSSIRRTVSRSSEHG
jgi:hypothetical protein